MSIFKGKHNFEQILVAANDTQMPLEKSCGITSVSIPVVIVASKRLNNPKKLVHFNFVPNYVLFCHYAIP